ncbi:MAG: indolepyruvate ferredoxin oxidoreductase family protein, partial [Alphaproteobacteria bacterium]|nr:indolepyruvate ferredoxin oxidoreductase family protein [Alphaproteobacteria bacterium]
GIVAAGKNYLDVRQAMDELGLDAPGAARAGIRVMKVGMVWPLEPEAMRSFAKGLDTVIVVEEKRALIELQLRDILYGEKTRPTVIGKRDEKGEALFASHGVLEPNLIARAIAERLGDRKLVARAAALPLASAAPLADLAERVPYFCAGCPHNTSTALPEEARGYAGIGCHWLAQFVPDRRTEGFTHMGGEGANWVGEAPFSTRTHVFQNIGDGTYNHSGLMAIRHAANSGANITYKILYNDAVAMTGGQRNDGGLSVPAIAQQVRSFGVERIAVVSDEEGKHGPLGFPAHVSFHHRDELAGLQREMMGVKGASVIIYDQTCAAEKRRRRRRGTLADPSQRVFINELVCEGCGDCGEQSNCVAIAPVETEFGRKRRIDQSVCNKDFSCLKGFCPSFVTVEGGALRKPETRRIEMPTAALPAPKLPNLARPWSILVAGIGGTGVVTIGHILGMAAHMEGKGAALIDMVGISQKNGAVVTHLKIAAEPSDIAAVRVARGGADLILGCDLVTAASARILAGASPQRTAAIVNGHETMPAQFTHDADFTLPARQILARIGKAVAGGQLFTVDATGLATRLLGDAMAANLFTLGYAWQKGLVPVGEEAILAAVRLNGVAVAMNIAAFGWGRRAAADEGAVRKAAGDGEAKGPESLAETIARRAEFLAAYQDEAYGASYSDFVAGVAARTPASFALTVARNLFKLMAYKDEYEVARLHSDPAFHASLARQFEGGYRLSFHLAPPLLARINPETGRPKKLRFGPWMMTALRLLARFKFLRGTRLDPFGRSAERRMERQLIADYRALIEGLMPRITTANLKTAEALAALPETIRGFGPVKEESIARAKARQAELLAA